MEITSEGIRMNDFWHSLDVARCQPYIVFVFHVYNS